MKVLEKLTLASLRENKRRTLVTVLGVMLSSALILAVVGMVTSIQKMMIDFTIADVGDYHDMYQEVPVEDLKYIEENAHVEKYFYSTPLTEKELGDDFETYESYQSAPYSKSQYQAIAVLPADAHGKYNIYVRYDKPQDYEIIRGNLLGILEANGAGNINVRTNSELLRYEGVMGDSTLSALYHMAAIVIGIIVVTSIFVIRNSFSISATERTRQFGMLSSIGATPRQIRQNVLFEGLIIAALGIPLGIILGILAVLVLVAVMNFLLADMIIARVTFSMPLWVFPFAVGLSVVTVLLSSLMPAIRTGRLSPIEAIRGNHDTKIKAKKLRTPGFVRGLWGVGGVIAYKNLKRSRKKYRTTVISIVLSVATFVGLSSFIGYGEKAAGVVYGNSDIDLVVAGASPEFYHELADKFDLKEYVYYERTNARAANLILMNREAFEDFAKSVGVNAKDYSKVAVMNDLGMTQDGPGQYRVERVHPALRDGDELETTLDNAVDVVTYSSTGTHIEHFSPDKENTKTIKLPITKLTEEKPLGFESYYGPMTFASEDYYLRDQLTVDEDTYQFFAANVGDVKAIIGYLDEVETSGKFEHLFYDDVKATTEQSRRIYLLISIFLYGFVAVVTLIGVTNIFNTITTNIALDNLAADPDMPLAVRQDFLRSSSRQVVAMTSLITTLLNLAKFDSGTIRMQRRVMPIGEILTQVYENLEILADLEEIEIKTVGDLSAQVKLDPHWQSEALSNIVKNCIEHSPAHSTVTITVEDSVLYTRVAIRDHGDGIAPQDLHHIFERFYKAEGASATSVGIGLSFAKSVIAADHGQVRVKSTPGNGTTFIVTYFH